MNKQSMCLPALTMKRSVPEPSRVHAQPSCMMFCRESTTTLVTQKRITTVLLRKASWYPVTMHMQYTESSGKTDDTNCTYMNKGIVVKFSANQKYTTDAVSSAVFAGICVKSRGSCSAFC